MNFVLAAFCLFGHCWVSQQSLADVEIATIEKHAESTLLLDMYQNGRIVGKGSAIVITSDGEALTANHVAEVGQLKATDKEGKTYNVKIIQLDAATDSALIKVEGWGGNHVTLGKSAALRPGDWLSQVGNGIDPLDRPQTFNVDTGYVVRLHINGIKCRDTLQDYIMTDANVSPGDSGGGVLNVKGELIGISTQGDVNRHYGLLVPIDLIKQRLPIMERS